MPALQEAPPKSCPKCRGSIIVERDWHGTYAAASCAGTCTKCSPVRRLIWRPKKRLCPSVNAVASRHTASFGSDS